MASQWYYAQQGQRKGPVSDEQLRQLASVGELNPTDLVWKNGMASWGPASEVEGLFASEDQPPPLPPDLPPALPQELSVGAAATPTAPFQAPSDSAEVVQAEVLPDDLPTTEEPSAPLSLFAKLRQKASETTSKAKEKWDGLTPANKSLVKRVGVTVATVAATAAAKHVLGHHHKPQAAGDVLAGGVVPDQDAQLIQNMKNAGTYSPEAEHNIRGLMDAARGKTSTSRSSIQRMTQESPR